MYPAPSSISQTPIPLELAGESPAVVQSREATRAAAATNAPVLIVAEPGFDPSRVAAAIHAGGLRAGQPFIRIDCGEPPDLVSRRLFGRARSGGRGGPRLSRDCALSAAGGGSVYLADVDQIPAAAQVRLSETLAGGELRVEGTRVPQRFRLLASSAPGLELEVEARRFRPELFRRLHRIRIDIPPLRDRAGDLAAILQEILGEVCTASGRARTFAPAALTALSSLRWPGNLDQVRATLTRLVQRSSGDVIRQEDVLADLEQRRPPEVGRPVPGGTAILRDARRAFERQYIRTVLEEQEWRMADAARVLGIDRANLYRKTRQLGISRAKGDRS